MKAMIFNKTIWLLLIGVCASAVAYAAEPTADGSTMEFTTAEERGTIPGGDENFTGKTTIQMLFLPNGPRNFSGAYVTFQQGARTNWHSHPAGQTIVVTEGTAWAQLEGQDRQELKPGDVLWTPPGVRHWHGANPTGAMTHLVVQGVLEGSAVHWGEHVSDSEYQGTEDE